VLVAQRDSEPGGNIVPTNIWKPGETVIDRHALVIPADLPSGDYSLIIGLYDIDNPSQRLTVKNQDYLSLGTLTIE
jgi:hypothetical protein